MELLYLLNVFNVVLYNDFIFALSRDIYRYKEQSPTSYQLHRVSADSLLNVPIYVFQIACTARFRTASVGSVSFFDCVILIFFKIIHYFRQSLQILKSRLEEVNISENFIGCKNCQQASFNYVIVSITKTYSRTS